MIDEKRVKELIDEAYVNMDSCRVILGKEIFQKRFKPVFEGYLTALCSIIEMTEDERTAVVKGKKDEL